MVSLAKYHCNNPEHNHETFIEAYSCKTPHKSFEHLYSLDYPGNDAMPWILDSRIFCFASSKHDAEEHFFGSGAWKEVRNCCRVTLWNEEEHNQQRQFGRPHPCRVLWENEIEKGKLEECRNKHPNKITWLKKQELDQLDGHYSVFPTTTDKHTWKYKIMTYCRYCGITIAKEEGTEGQPTETFNGWRIIPRPLAFPIRSC